MADKGSPPAMDFTAKQMFIYCVTGDKSVFDPPSEEEQPNPTAVDITRLLEGIVDPILSDFSDADEEHTDE